MELKWAVAAAVMASNMPPPMRLIMLVFLDGADVGDAVIPERFTPSLTDLVDRTGLGRGTVAARLNDLEDGGWVKRDRPSAAAARAGAKTRYALAIGDPDAGLKPKEQKPASPDSSSPGAGLVREPDQAPSPRAGLALVREPDGGSPGAGPDLVREPDGSTTHQPTTTHQDPPTSPVGDDSGATLPGLEATKPPPKPKPKRAKSGLTPAPEPEGFPLTDAMRAYAADKCPDVTDLEFHTEQFLTHHAAKGSKFKNWVMAWQRWLRNEQQWGGSRASPRRHQPYQDPDPASYHGDI